MIDPDATSRWAVSANLFLVGAMKSATSSLHDYLALHPAVFMSEHKEPHYFSHGWRVERDAYEERFAAGRSATYRGESSTGYGVFPGVAERIAQDTTDPRILLSLRNPIDRAWSHYWWLRAQGQERRGFAESFESDRGRDADPDDPIRGTGNFRFYDANGRYGSMVGRYLDVFGAGSIWITDFSRLIDDPDAVLADCCDFLGIDPPDRLPAIHSNETRFLRYPRVVRAADVVTASSAGRALRRWVPGGKRPKEFVVGAVRRRTNEADYPSMDAATRAWLAEHYRAEVDLLRERWPAAGTWWQADFPTG